MSLRRRSLFFLLGLLAALVPGVVDASDAVAAVAPPSGRIVFARDSGIWIMNSPGATPVQLTSGPDSDPKLSPGGTRIVFERGIPDFTLPPPWMTVWVVNVDGSDLHQVTAPIEPVNPDECPDCGWVGIDRDPQWSPDGNQIVFVREGFTLNEGVVIMNTDGSDPRVVEGGPGWQSSDPSWSPDGTKIAFSWTYSDLEDFIILKPADGSSGTRWWLDPADDFVLTGVHNPPERRLETTSSVRRGLRTVAVLPSTTTTAFRLLMPTGRT